MPNTLNGLMPTLFQAVDVVSRELVGFIPAVTMDASAERAAIGQVVNAFQTTVGTMTDITPAVTPPDDGDQTINATGITITRAKRVPVRWNGEQTLQMNTGPGQPNIVRDQFAQAMRVLVNAVEADLAALYWNASRASGTAGTAPFQSDLSDPANLRKILSDNGAPLSDLQLVIGTTAGAKVRSLAQLNKANEAGTTSLRERGALLEIHGFTLRESAAIKSVVAGTGANYVVNNVSGYAAGATGLAVQTGTGTVLQGDVVTFAGDSRKYVVNSALTAGALGVNNPGLQQALANNTAMSVGASYTANMAFARTAMLLATRAPALPPNGDLAIDRTFITDPVSGLTFEVSIYPQYRAVQYEVALAWGYTCCKPEHLAILLG